jgi:hypothetical protein
VTYHLISSSGLESKKKAELKNHWKSMSGSVPNPSWTKSDLISGIRKMIEAERERRFTDASKPKRAPSLCEITASEVNDWLKTLPRKDAA